MNGASHATSFCSGSKSICLLHVLLLSSARRRWGRRRGRVEGARRPEHRRLALELRASPSTTQPISDATMRMQPSTVMMYVPVELAPPNVQKSVTVSLHSSYGKRRTWLLLTLRPWWSARPLVRAGTPRAGSAPPSTSRPSGSTMTSGTRSNSGIEVLLELGHVEALELDLGRNAQEVELLEDPAARRTRAGTRAAGRPACPSAGRRTTTGCC